VGLRLARIELRLVPGVPPLPLLSTNTTSMFESVHYDSSPAALKYINPRSIEDAALNALCATSNFEEFPGTLLSCRLNGVKEGIESGDGMVCEEV
jgi:hypothetical protein